MRINKDVIYLPKGKIKEAVKTYPTPFFIYEEKRLRDNCRRFKDAFRKYFPDFVPLYAVKANPNPHILRIVKSEGFGADASSPSESYLARKLRMKGMYTGNYTTAQELKAAKKARLILNLDDISNLSFLKEIGVPKVLSFRINPGIGKATEKSNVFAGPDAKYGVPHEKAAEAYKKAKALGVKKFGIHIMTGSNVPIEDQGYFANIVTKLLKIIADIKKKAGVEIAIMNIGGGFGVPYRPEEKSLDIEKIAKSLRNVMDKECKKLGIKEPQLWVEPGRFITADMGWLIGKVTVIKDGYKKFVGIDAASNDMPRPSIYNAYHHATIVEIAAQHSPHILNVHGRTIEQTQEIRRHVEVEQLGVFHIAHTLIVTNHQGHHGNHHGAAIRDIAVEQINRVGNLHQFLFFIDEVADGVQIFGKIVGSHHLHIGASGGLGAKMRCRADEVKEAWLRFHLVSSENMFATGNQIFFFQVQVAVTTGLVKHGSLLLRFKFW